MVRNITIVDNKSQSRYDFETEGTKLKDIIAGCKSLGISTEDVEFQEAYSRTVLRDPEAILPSNVPTGHGNETTNDLVIVITAPKKKIKSGAMSRADAYAYIKANGLSDKVLSMYGRNYTQCRTDDLVVICEEHMASANKAASRKENENPKTEDNKKSCCEGSSIVKKAMALNEELYKNNAITKSVYSNFKSVLEGGEAAPVKKRISDDELNKLVGRMKY